MSWKMGFDRKALSKEFLVEVLARLLAHEHAAAGFVLTRTACAAQHLEDVGDRIVDVAMLSSLVVLDAHNDDHVG